MRVAWVVMLVAGCWRQAAPEPLQDPPRRKPPTDLPWLHQAHRKPKSQRTDLSPIAASLSQVEGFALGGVGVTGTKTEGELLAVALSHEPDARLMFERLAMDPNPAARLYAYWALRTLDPSLAQRVRVHLAHDTNLIMTMSGCIMHQVAVNALADAIDRLPPPRALPRP